MKISLIMTILNEGESLRPLLNSIIKQTRQPDEIIITDGGSHDQTCEIIEEYKDRLPIMVIVVPGANISCGRNVAIAAAKGDLIACTDAGVVLAPEWLASLAEPAEDPHQKSEVIAGFFLPQAHTIFERAMGATVLPALEEIDPTTFLPSSRSFAFTPAAWKRAGGYPEWLDYCEDLLFDFALREKGYHFAWAPRAIAYFRPRSSLRAFFTQYYRYSRGDGKADLWRKRHFIRYTTYVLGGATLLYALLRRPFWPLAYLLISLGGFVYLAKPLRRLWPQLNDLFLPSKIQAVLWLPLIRLCGDIAKMYGYPVGLLWRLRHFKRSQTMPESD